MRIGTFCEAIAVLGIKYKGSITSWGRSTARSLQVGGFAGDPHSWWVGADMVYDRDVYPDLAELKAEAAALGIKVIREENKGHDHFQPLDIPSGPVVKYNYA